MKYAILGDIHANLEALKAVIHDATQQQVDRYACTGDLVGYNADPHACLRLLRNKNPIVVQGNHDYYATHDLAMDLFASSARKSILWTRKHLSISDRKYLKSLPLLADTEHFTLVHSSLFDPSCWEYVSSILAVHNHFLNQFTPLCFIGHTHIPAAFLNHETIQKISFSTDQPSFQLQPKVQYLINVGSVGQPRDKNPQAAYVIYDSSAQTICLRRVEYDLATTQKKIRSAGLPFQNALRLSTGK